MSSLVESNEPLRSQLIESVREDPHLEPGEKETVVRFSKADDRMYIYTEEAGIARRLLSHDEFDVTELRVTREDVWGKRVEPEAFCGGDVTGVAGYGPVGLLKVQSGSRSASGHASVVSKSG